MKRILCVSGGFVALVLMGWVSHHETQFVYDCKHQVMERILADAHGWYYGAHGEGLSTEQADLVYNDASDALRDLGNATSK